MGCEGIEVRRKVKDASGEVEKVVSEYAGLLEQNEKIVVLCTERKPVSSFLYRNGALELGKLWWIVIDLMIMDGRSP